MMRRPKRKYKYYFHIGNGKLRCIFIKAPSATCARSRGAKKAREIFPDCEMFIYTSGVYLT